MTLYKFKTIEPFDRVVNILLSGELYCPTASQLNDPMEGILGIQMEHLFDPESMTDSRPHLPLMRDDVWQAIGAVLDRYRVCCFSEDPHSTLMWTYYGGAHSGLCFEVEVDPKLRPVHRVIYVEDPATVDISHPTRRLRYKLKHWEHEQECRVILEDYDHMERYPVRIRSVILGSAVPMHYYNTLARLSKKAKCKLERVAFTSDGKAIRMSSDGKRLIR